MKATAGQKIRLGIFTLSGIVIFMAALFAIGSKKNLFADTFSIYGAFRNVGGLQIGNLVRFSGIDAGTVSAIIIENDSTVRVTMQLKRKVRRFVKDDAVASIGSDGLMGDKLINISPGPVGANLLAEGGQIRTANPIEFDKIINKISHVADNAEVITSSLAGISKQINSGKGTIGRLIYTDTLERGLERTVKSVHETVNDVHATIKSVHETVDSAKKGVQSFDENMEAAKSNILLKGFFKKKERQERRKERKQEREERREEKKEHK